MHTPRWILLQNQKQQTVIELSTPNTLLKIIVVRLPIYPMASYYIKIRYSMPSARTCASVSFCVDMC